MYGLMLLGIALVYIALVGWLIYKVKRWSRRAAIAVVAILIPNADDWYYRYQLAQYCKNEAGYKVYEQVSRREGVVSADLFIENFTQVTPLAFIEGSSNKANGQGERVTTLWRSDRRPDGTATPEYAVKTHTALYETISTRTERGPLVVSGYQIVRRSDQKLIAEFKRMDFMGGWYPRVLLPEGLVAGCTHEGGQVASRQQLRKEKYSVEDTSFNRLIRQTFTKD